MSPDNSRHVCCPVLSTVTVKSCHGHKYQAAVEGAWVLCQICLGTLLKTTVCLTEWNWSKKTWRQAFGKEILMRPGIGHYHQTDCSNPFQLKCKISTANNTCDLMTCFTLPWAHGWLGVKYQGSYQFVSHWESQNTQETNQAGQDSAYWKSENTHSLSSGCTDEVLLSVLRCQLTY